MTPLLDGQTLPATALGRDTVPYGIDLTADSPLGKLTLTTARLPVDPKARDQS